MRPILRFRLLPVLVLLGVLTQPLQGEPFTLPQLYDGPPPGSAFSADPEVLIKKNGDPIVRV